MIKINTFIKKIQEELSLALPLVFSETVFKQALYKILRKYRITDETIITNLSKTVEKVPLKWNIKTDYKLLTFDSSKIQIIDILVHCPIKFLHLDFYHGNFKIIKFWLYKAV